MHRLSPSVSSCSHFILGLASILVLGFLAREEDSLASFWSHFFMPYSLFLLLVQGANNIALHLLSLLGGKLLCLHCIGLGILLLTPPPPVNDQHLTHAEPVGPFPSPPGF